MSRKTKSASRKERKAAKHKLFRFGVPLDHLPCTYLSDCGYVPTFLVEAGDVIKSQVETHGLFGRTGEIRLQNEMKAYAERGQDLHQLDVHEVASLMKTFLRLLPEPLIPCLFHDPLLSCLLLPPAKQAAAIQGLCFSLPATNLSCLRYFLRLLAYVASFSHINRMTPRNLAVVLTPTVIRLKTRTKLMTREELRVLPQQTALVEHLIRHADAIGSMPSEVHQHTVEGTAEVMRKKMNKKKRRSKDPTMDPEERVGVARAAVGLVAGLHFRPNTSNCVSDTLLVDGQHVQQLDESTNATLNLPPSSVLTKATGQAFGSARARSCSVPGKPFRPYRPVTGLSRVRRRRKSTSCQPVTHSKELDDPLLKSWSTAIPVIDTPCSSSEDQSDDSAWSDLWSYVSREAEDGIAEGPASSVGTSIKKHMRSAGIGKLTKENVGACSVRLDGPKETKWLRECVLQPMASMSDCSFEIRNSLSETVQLCHLSSSSENVRSHDASHMCNRFAWFAQPRPGQDVSESRSLRSSATVQECIQLLLEIDPSLAEPSSSPPKLDGLWGTSDGFADRCCDKTEGMKINNQQHQFQTSVETGQRRQSDEAGETQTRDYYVPDAHELLSQTGAAYNQRYHHVGAFTANGFVKDTIPPNFLETSVDFQTQPAGRLKRRLLRRKMVQQTHSLPGTPAQFTQSMNVQQLASPVDGRPQPAHLPAPDVSPFQDIPRQAQRPLRFPHLASHLDSLTRRSSDSTRLAGRDLRISDPRMHAFHYDPVDASTMSSSSTSSSKQSFHGSPRPRGNQRRRARESFSKSSFRHGNPLLNYADPRYSSSFDPRYSSNYNDMMADERGYWQRCPGDNRRPQRQSQYLQNDRLPRPSPEMFPQGYSCHPYSRGPHRVQQDATRGPGMSCSSTSAMPHHQHYPYAQEHFQFPNSPDFQPEYRPDDAGYFSYGYELPRPPPPGHNLYHSASHSTRASNDWLDETISDIEAEFAKYTRVPSSVPGARNAFPALSTPQDNVQPYYQQVPATVTSQPFVDEGSGQEDPRMILQLEPPDNRLTYIQPTAPTESCENCLQEAPLAGNGTPLSLQGQSGHEQAFFLQNPRSANYQQQDPTHESYGPFNPQETSRGARPPFVHEGGVSGSRQPFIQGAPRAPCENRQPFILQSSACDPHGGQHAQPTHIPSANNHEPVYPAPYSPCYEDDRSENHCRICQENARMAAFTEARKFSTMRQIDEMEISFMYDMDCERDCWYAYRNRFEYDDGGEFNFRPLQCGSSTGITYRERFVKYRDSCNRRECEPHWAGYLPYETTPPPLYDDWFDTEAEYVPQEREYLLDEMRHVDSRPMHRRRVLRHESLVGNNESGDGSVAHREETSNTHAIDTVAQATTRGSVENKPSSAQAATKGSVENKPSSAQAATKGSVENKPSSAQAATKGSVENKPSPAQAATKGSVENKPSSAQAATKGSVEIKPSPAQATRGSVEIKPSPAQATRSSVEIKPSSSQATTRGSVEIKPSPAQATTRGSVEIKPSPAQATTRGSVENKPSPAQATRGSVEIKPSPTQATARGSVENKPSPAQATTKGSVENKPSPAQATTRGSVEIKPSPTQATTRGSVENKSSIPQATARGCVENKPSPAQATRGSVENKPSPTQATRGSVEIKPSPTQATTRGSVENKSSIPKATARGSVEIKPSPSQATRGSVEIKPSPTQATTRGSVENKSSIPQATARGRVENKPSPPQATRGSVEIKPSPDKMDRQDTVEQDQSRQICETMRVPKEESGFVPTRDDTVLLSDGLPCPRSVGASTSWNEEDEDLSDKTVTEGDNETDQEGDHGADQEGDQEVDHGADQEGDQEGNHGGDHGADREGDHGADQERDHGADQEGDHGADLEVDHGADQEGDHGAEQEVDHGADLEVDHGADQEGDHGANHRADQEVDHGADQEVDHEGCTATVVEETKLYDNEAMEDSNLLENKQTDTHIQENEQTDTHILENEQTDTHILENEQTDTHILENEQIDTHILENEQTIRRESSEYEIPMTAPEDECTCTENMHTLRFQVYSRGEKRDDIHEQSNSTAEAHLRSKPETDYPVHTLHADTDAVIVQGRSDTQKPVYFPKSELEVKQQIQMTESALELPRKIQMTESMFERLSRGSQINKSDSETGPYHPQENESEWETGPNPPERYESDGETVSNPSASISKPRIWSFIVFPKTELRKDGSLKDKAQHHQAVKHAPSLNVDKEHKSSPEGEHEAAAEMEQEEENGIAASPAESVNKGSIHQMCDTVARISLGQMSNNSARTAVDHLSDHSIRIVENPLLDDPIEESDSTNEQSSVDCDDTMVWISDISDSSCKMVDNPSLDPVPRQSDSTNQLSVNCGDARVWTSEITDNPARIVENTLLDDTSPMQIKESDVMNEESPVDYGDAMVWMSEIEENVKRIITSLDSSRVLECGDICSKPSDQSDAAQEEADVDVDHQNLVEMIQTAAAKRQSYRSQSVTCFNEEMKRSNIYNSTSHVWSEGSMHTVARAQSADWTELYVRCDSQSSSCSTADSDTIASLISPQQLAWGSPGRAICSDSLPLEYLDGHMSVDPPEVSQRASGIEVTFVSTSVHFPSEESIPEAVSLTNLCDGDGDPTASVAVQSDENVMIAEGNESQTDAVYNMENTNYCACVKTDEQCDYEPYKLEVNDLDGERDEQCDYEPYKLEVNDLDGERDEQCDYEPYKLEVNDLDGERDEQCDYEPYKLEVNDLDGESNELQDNSQVTKHVFNSVHEETSLTNHLGVTKNAASPDIKEDEKTFDEDSVCSCASKSAVDNESAKSSSSTSESDDGVTGNLGHCRYRTRTVVAAALHQACLEINDEHVSDSSDERSSSGSCITQVSNTDHVGELEGSELQQSVLDYSCTEVCRVQEGGEQCNAILNNLGDNSIHNPNPVPPHAQQEFGNQDKMSAISNNEISGKNYDQEVLVQEHRHENDMTAGAQPSEQQLVGGSVVSNIEPTGQNYDQQVLAQEYRHENDITAGAQPSEQQPTSGSVVSNNEITEQNFNREMLVQDHRQENDITAGVQPSEQQPTSDCVVFNNETTGQNFDQEVLVQDHRQENNITAGAKPSEQQPTGGSVVSNNETTGTNFDQEVLVQDHRQENITASAQPSEQQPTRDSVVFNNETTEKNYNQEVLVREHRQENDVNAGAQPSEQQPTSGSVVSNNEPTGKSFDQEELVQDHRQENDITASAQPSEQLPTGGSVVSNDQTTEQNYNQEVLVQEHIQENNIIAGAQPFEQQLTGGSVVSNDEPTGKNYDQKVLVQEHRQEKDITAGAQPSEQQPTSGSVVSNDQNTVKNYNQQVLAQENRQENDMTAGAQPSEQQPTSYSVVSNKQNSGKNYDQHVLVQEHRQDNDITAQHPTSDNVVKDTTVGSNITNQKLDDRDLLGSELCSKQLLDHQEQLSLLEDQNIRTRSSASDEALHTTKRRRVCRRNREVMLSVNQCSDSDGYFIRFQPATHSDHEAEHSSQADVDIEEEALFLGQGHTAVITSCNQDNCSASGEQNSSAVAPDSPPGHCTLESSARSVVKPKIGSASSVCVHGSERHDSFIQPANSFHNLISVPKVACPVREAGADLNDQQHCRTSLHSHPSLDSNCNHSLQSAKLQGFVAAFQYLLNKKSQRVRSPSGAESGHYFRRCVVKGKLNVIRLGGKHFWTISHSELACQSKLSYQ